VFSIRYLARAISALFFVASLAACAGNSTIVPSAQLLAPQSLSPTVAVPGPCAGQATRQKYASITEALGSRGGILCIPAFRGFGGSLQYPAAKSSNEAGLISSTTDYNKNLPRLGTGSPMFYLQISTSGAASFGKRPATGGGLEGQTIKPGQTYTVYSRATLGGIISAGSSACYVKAKTNAFGGAIGGLGAVFKFSTVTGIGPQTFQALIEVYPGKQVKSKCS
jgi:hypothetical protein